MSKEKLKYVYKTIINEKPSKSVNARIIAVMSPDRINGTHLIVRKSSRKEHFDYVQKFWSSHQLKKYKESLYKNPNYQVIMRGNLNADKYTALKKQEIEFIKERPVKGDKLGNTETSNVKAIHEPTCTKIKYSQEDINRQDFSVYIRQFLIDIDKDNMVFNYTSHKFWKIFKDNILNGTQPYPAGARFNIMREFYKWRIKKITLYQNLKSKVKPTSIHGENNMKIEGRVKDICGNIESFLKDMKVYPTHYTECKFYQTFLDYVYYGKYSFPTEYVRSYIKQFYGIKAEHEIQLRKNVASYYDKVVLETRILKDTLKEQVIQPKDDKNDLVLKILTAQLELLKKTLLDEK